VSHSLTSQVEEATRTYKTTTHHEDRKLSSSAIISQIYYANTVALFDYCSAGGCQQHSSAIAAMTKKASQEK